MSFDFPEWPPKPYKSGGNPDLWLRSETQYPTSQRPSRLVSHSVAPYVFTQAGGSPDRETLGSVASNYLTQLQDYLKDNKMPLEAPEGWGEDAINVSGQTPEDVNLMHWLDIWPPVGNPDVGKTPQIASWNLSRDAAHALPATIVMVATEFVDGEGNIAQFTTGITVPMLVEQVDGDLRVIIRSMTAEYPNPLQKSWSTVNAIVRFDGTEQRQTVLGALTQDLIDDRSDIINAISQAASVFPKSLSLEQIYVISDLGASLAEQPVVIETTFKARGNISREPNALSYLVVNRIEAKLVSQFPSIQFDLTLLGTETCAMVTHVNAGQAKVLTHTPPASVLPFDPEKPDAEYKWMRRRPTRTDEILDRFRETVTFTDNGETKALEEAGFRIRRCPEFVHQDREDLGSSGPTKKVHLPAHKEIALRSNEFSALSAYYNCKDFFEMLASFGIDPVTFAARSEPDIQVYYRFGITPGPGKDGRTVNAQVAFDCDADDTLRPPVRMNLALAELTRWDRPEHSDGARSWAQPFGIATDKRWMLHEFSHYLLAARLGRLEFEFAHSVGDAMAAIACDPDSRLADPRNGVADSFRGLTYPFVFTTRRHDRSPTLGWAWYGELNRSVIESPPLGCDDLKGYLTEQILSTTLFRLYRALGGDAMIGDTPDVYLRQRASFLTLYLVVRAICNSGQSPTRAEMYELAMETAGLLQGDDDVLEMVPQPITTGTMPQPDGWKGGLTHKVVRWAFETQGMFVEDRTATCNTAGRPPEVDTYILDQRPLSEMVNGSRFTYGPGSYCPVSTDWDGAALWQMPEGHITFGNRGFVDASHCHLRAWLGFVVDADASWGLVSTVFWVSQFVDMAIDDIPAGDTRPFALDEAQQDSIASAKIQAQGELGENAVLLVLFELTCPDDRANTDPAQLLAVRVGSKPDGSPDLSNLPKTPRALTDLVANDNNLGLQVIQTP